MTRMHDGPTFLYLYACVVAESWAEGIAYVGTLML